MNEQTIQGPQKKKNEEKKFKGSEKWRKNIQIWQFSQLEDFGRVFLHFSTPLHFFSFFLLLWPCMVFAVFFNTINPYYMTIFFFGFSLKSLNFKLTFLPVALSELIWFVFVTSIQNHLRRIGFWNPYFPYLIIYCVSYNGRGVGCSVVHSQL